MEKLELIVPCSKFGELEEVFSLGDAVYVGIAGWSRSDRGDEFSLVQLRKAVEIAKERGKRIYVSFNVIPSPMEVRMACNVLEDVVSCGIDAVIASDVGILKKVVNWGIEAHASLGTSIINLEDVMFYVDIGVDRVILSPNLTLEEIGQITRALEGTTCEVEIMVYGLKCSMTYLGVCRLSSFLEMTITNQGVRTLVWEGSPKRSGVCYRPCAQDWDCDDVVVRLAPMVNCHLYPVERLFDIGVRYFKIGGRGMPMKYVKKVVSDIKKSLETRCGYADI